MNLDVVPCREYVMLGDQGIKIERGRFPGFANARGIKGILNFFDLSCSIL